jgi:hypothetical protein
MKESMVIYENAYKAIGYLPDEKSQLEALKGLLEYGFYDTIPESDNPLIKIIFTLAIPNMSKRQLIEHLARASQMCHNTPV